MWRLRSTFYRMECNAVFWGIFRFYLICFAHRENKTWRLYRWMNEIEIKNICRFLCKLRGRRASCSQFFGGMISPKLVGGAWFCPIFLGWFAGFYHHLSRNSGIAMTIPDHLSHLSRKMSVPVHFPYKSSCSEIGIKLDYPIDPKKGVFFPKVLWHSSKVPRFLIPQNVFFFEDLWWVPVKPRHPWQLPAWRFPSLRQWISESVMRLRNRTKHRREDVSRGLANSEIEVPI